MLYTYQSASGAPEQVQVASQAAHSADDEHSCQDCPIADGDDLLQADILEHKETQLKAGEKRIHVLEEQLEALQARRGGHPYVYT